MKSTTFKVVGTLVFLLLFGWILAQQDLANVWRVVQAMPARDLFGALGLLLLTQVLNAWRWHILLKSQAIGLTFLQTVGIAFGGAFASNFLPSTVGGDAFRGVAVGWLAPREKRGVAMVSVAVDRMVNLANRLCFLPTLLVFSSSSSSATPALAFFLSGKDIKQKLRAALGTLQAWRDQPRALALSFAVATLSNLSPIAAVWLLARGLDMPVSFLEVVGASTLIYFITLLPISINGYGLKEGLYAVVYPMLGATPEQAIALALLARVFLLLSSLPGIFSFLTIKKSVSE